MAFTSGATYAEGAVGIHKPTMHGIRKFRDGVMLTDGIESARAPVMRGIRPLDLKVQVGAITCERSGERLHLMSLTVSQRTRAYSQFDDAMGILFETNPRDQMERANVS